MILEIGFGMGENVIELSQRNKNKKIIGIEPLLNGQYFLADYCLKNNINNVLIYTEPAQIFISVFKKFIFDSIYILFPDPWHKKKHKKRRLLNKEFIKKIVLKSKKIYFLSDNFDYFSNILQITKNLLQKKKIISFSTKKFKIAKTKYLNRAKKLNKRLYFLTIDIS
ncbi:MAG: hypothetical protein CMI81_01455 [Candidatus Pelagibacter sp.]|nr:hypothetical protein [Candidatus Pelagibacter sp.]OUV98059.1 MAG: hypothetical protein CBD02_02070 [Candidatus Pelagibacter sp. TMED142]